MNKADLIDEVAESAGVTKQQAEGVLEAFFSTTKIAVATGDRVAWPSFGSFSATARKARTGRNPRTGEPVKIAASTAVKFTPSAALKDYLNPKKGKKAAANKTAPAKKTAAKKAPAKKARK